MPGELLLRKANVMAYRLYPFSAFPATEGKVYPDAIRTNTNDFWLEGLGVVASLGSDAELHYVFRVPGGLPTGTAKLEVTGFSYDANGDAKINPKWKSVAYEEDIDLAASSLNAEGTNTITWATGNDAHQFKQLKVALDADTIVAGEFIVLRLVLESTSWTLNTRAIFNVSIIWE
jgi:hypothetical protein